MELGLALDGTVPTAQVGDVVELLVLHQGHGTGDDIDIVGHRQPRNLVDNVQGELRQEPHGIHRGFVRLQGHQRGTEEFREHRDVALVVGQRVHEILHLLEEIVHALELAHLPLHAAHPGTALARPDQFGLARGVINIVPLQQCGIAAGLPVLGHIGAEHPFDIEVVGDLERQCGVVDILVLDLLNVFEGRHFPGVLLVVGNTPAGNDGLEVEVAAQLLARVVQTPPQSQPPVIRIHEQIHTVKDIAVGIVGSEVVVAGNLVVGVLVAELAVIHNDREAGRGHLAAVLDTELPLRKG